MRNLAKALHLLSSFAVLACSPKVLPPPAATSSSDSVQIEIREYFIHDSIPYEVPVIIEKNMTRDTTSHLENDWAESDASLADGFLEHTLKTKGRTVYIPVQVPVHDTTYIERHSETKPEYIERDLTEREKRLIRRGKAAGWALALLAAAGVAAVALKFTGFNPVSLFRRKV